MGEDIMAIEEQKQAAIDYYVNLMRIKASQTSENKELYKRRLIFAIYDILFVRRLSGLLAIFNHHIYRLSDSSCRSKTLNFQH